MRLFIASALALGGCNVCTLSHHDIAAVQLKTFNDAMEIYRVKTGSRPAKISDLIDHWERPFISEIPSDPWDRDYVYIRPSCLLSRGADGKLGTEDDITLNCDSELINQQVLLEAGLNGEVARRDVYGRPIHFVNSGKVLLAWSYGQDGKPDTQDDQVARIAANAVRRD